MASPTDIKTLLLIVIHASNTYALDTPTTNIEIWCTFNTKSDNAHVRCHTYWYRTLKQLTIIEE